MKKTLLPVLVLSSILVWVAQGAERTLMISEFVANNARTLADEDGDFPDWIEIHNPTLAAVPLGGWYLTDDPAVLTKWAFPPMSLSAGSYLVVFASGKNRTGDPTHLHTNFQLDNAGEYLALVQPDGTNIADAYSPAFPAQKEDIAYGVAQNQVATSLLGSAIPRILVPTNAAELAADWNQPLYEPGANWRIGATPLALGFDTNEPVAALANIAGSGIPVQSTTASGGAATLAIDGSTASATQTLPTDNAPFWQLSFSTDTAIYRIVLVNRTSCCQSRLRDITVVILAADGVTTNYASPLLNPENAGYVYPAGPASLSLDLTALVGGAVSGRIVRVHRTPDPDLSGSGGQGTSDEAAALSLAEVEIYGAGAGSDVNLARTGSPAPTATQSTTLSSYTANLGIDGNPGNFTHTTSADPNANWMLNLGRRALIKSVTVHNRESCCQSRLRDITVEILDANGTTVLYTSPLLNPENTGYTFPGGPTDLVVDLGASPVLGQYVRVRRTADPDLSGTGGQGNNDEATVLSLGEVIVTGQDVTSYRPFIRTDLQGAMLGVNASAFVRLPFLVADPAILDSLTLQARYDDGFAVFLNGAKIAERNAPAVLGWNSAATAQRTIGASIQPETIDLTAYIPQLSPGTNLLAIQALNFSASDGDFLLQPELRSTHVETSDRAYLADPTPGTRNQSPYFFGDVADTQFSVDRGFFDAPFTVEITSATPGAEIYYSFDCSEPDALKGIRYTGPIAISNTAVLRARAFKAGLRATDTDTQTYIFITDVLNQAADFPATSNAPPYFPRGWGNNKVDYGMDPNVVAQYSAAEWREAFTQVPTMSVVTEMGNLFDPATGIYANALQHGIDWERPGSLELLDPTNAVQGRFQENCGLRIRGGYSRNPQFVKHSFRVFFRREYGEPKLHYPLFEDQGATEFDTFDLRTSQNYSWPRESSYNNGRHDTMVREVFCRETLGAMGQPYRRSRYYHLFLNGQYWGLYETDERPEASFGSTYLGGAKDDYDVVKCANHVGGFVTEATDGDFGAWSNLWTMCLAVLDNPTDANYFRVLGCNPDGTRNPALPVMLDVDNLIDYMLGIFYTGDGDATLSAFLSNTRPNNWFGMKNRNNPDQGFIFVNSDCEHTLGAPSWREDRTGPFKDLSGSNVRNFTYANPQYFHEELMLNAEYRLRFADHVQKHFFNGGVLTPEAGTNRFLRKAVQINKAMRAYSARWGDVQREPPYGETDWQTVIGEIINNWFPGRTTTVLNQLKADNLFPNINAPNFSQYGGILSNQEPLTMSHNNGVGTIYYTLDGTDPRLIGGTVNPAALSYSSPVAIGANSRVKARVLSGATWSALAEADFAVPGVLPLRITEIMYHPAPVTAAEAAQGYTDPDLFEYLELRNIGSQTINLAGISFVNGITFTFTQGTLAAGQRLVLVKNPAAFALRYGAGANVAGYYEGNLRNSGERLVLQDALGQIIHDFSYSDNWVPLSDGFGFSLGIVDETAPLYTWDSSANWQASAALGGSPGSENPLLPAYPSVFIHELLAHPLPGGKVTVELANVGSSPADVSGWWLSDDFRLPKKFRLPPDTIIPAGGFVTFTEDDFNAPGQGTNAFNFSLGGGEARLFSADGNGNLTGYYQGWDYGASEPGVSFGRVVTSTGSDQFFAQQAVTLGDVNAGPLVGPVVINEIMYHPPDIGTNDNSLDEFIELLNVSSNTVLLYAPLAPTNTWRISGGVDFNLPLQLQLAPGQYLLLVNFSPADGVQLEAFRTQYAVPAETPIYGPYSGKLDNGGEPVELKKPMLLPNGVAVDVLVDKVRYEDYAPWPCNTDGSGRSLQRLAGDAYGNDPVNWSGSPPTAGAATVPEPPGLATIAQEPVDLVVRTNSQAIFVVQACAPGQPHYQWLYNGSLLDNATNALLALDNVQLANSGTYQVVITTAGGSVTSRVAELIVQTPPWIEVQPQGLTVLGYTPATFAVTAGGIAPFGYQWRFNGADLPGETNATLVLPAVENAQEGEYRVLVHNTAGTALSDAANLTVNLPVRITAQPSDIVTTNNYSVAFTAAATGDGSVTWQWYFAGAPLAGANSPTLNRSAVQSADEGPYYAVASNAYGSDTSRVAQLTVLVMPTIVDQPQSQLVALGGALTLTVGVDGSRPMGFRWRRNSVTLVPFGEGTDTFLVPQVTIDEAGRYDVIVTNAARLTGVGSRPAYVSVVQPPANRMVLAGSSVTLAAAVWGTGTHLYQWRHDGQPLAGETSTNLVLNSLQAAQSGTYTLTVSNTLGLMAGDFSCSVTVQDTAMPPEITQQPSNAVAAINGEVSFAVDAIGTEPLVYQWWFNATNLLADATNALLTISGVQETDLGNYTVIVSNPAGALTSTVASLTLPVPPSIVAQPADQSATEGGAATFAVTADGTPPLSYQWWFNETNVLAEATGTTLTLTNVQAADAGGYRVVVTSAAGSATSAVARLTVAAGDRDGDGLPDDYELAHGLNPDNADDGTIDTDRDGLTNAQEYRAGTNPTNAASVLQLEMPAAVGGAPEVLLRFHAVSNRSYTIEFRDRIDLGLWQEVLAVEAAPSNRTVEVTNTLGTSTSQRYYRIGTPKP